MESNDKNSEAINNSIDDGKWFTESEYLQDKDVFDFGSELDKEDKATRIKPFPKRYDVVDDIAYMICDYARGCDFQASAMKFNAEAGEKLKDFINQKINILEIPEQLLLQESLSERLKLKDIYGHDICPAQQAKVINKFIVLISERIANKANETLLKSAYPSHRGTVGKKVPNDNLGSSKKSINKHNI